MTRFKIFMIYVFLSMTGCNSNDSMDFSLTIEHYGGGGGITIIYIIDNNGLKVNTNCDLEDCKEVAVYKRTFSKAESDSILRTLNSFRLDTLRSSYKYQGYYNDGFFTEIKLRRGLFSSHKSTFENISTPTLDSLNAFIDKLVTKPEFRFMSWGESQ